MLALHDALPIYLVQRPVRRLARAQPFAHMLLDRLDDDDRVVDVDADREHEREQRQRIDRKAERALYREGADERDRDGDERDDGSGPGQVGRTPGRASGCTYV